MNKHNKVKTDHIFREQTSDRQRGRKWGRKELGEEDKKAQTSSYRIKVMSLKCTV